jgi:hypothetical protein
MTSLAESWGSLVRQVYQSPGIGHIFVTREIWFVRLTGWQRRGGGEYAEKGQGQVASRQEGGDEDITMSTTTPAAPPHQAQLPSLAGPITRARARDLNFVMLLKNEGPEE